MLILKKDRKIWNACPIRYQSMIIKNMVLTSEEVIKTVELNREQRRKPMLIRKWSMIQGALQISVKRWADIKCFLHN